MLLSTSHIKIHCLFLVVCWYVAHKPSIFLFWHWIHFPRRSLGYSCMYCVLKSWVHAWRLKAGGSLANVSDCISSVSLSGSGESVLKIPVLFPLLLRGKDTRLSCSELRLGIVGLRCIRYFHSLLWSEGNRKRGRLEFYAQEKQEEKC